MTNAHDAVPYEKSMIVGRPHLTWPNNKSVAFSIVISAEYYELQPPENAFKPANLPGGFGPAPYPDMRAFSQREYGNRVGIFRVMEAFDRHSFRATAAVDANVATRYPNLIEQFLRRGWEIACHGLSLTQVISNHMSIEEERIYIQSSLAQLEKVSGLKPEGWHGPEYGESERTPMLLAEAGLGYVLDWPNDEQPYWMSTEAGAIVSMPMALELDDVVANYHRRITMERWRQAVSEALDQISADSSKGARQLVLNLHPWLIGQPHRISFLEAILEDVGSRSDVWFTTTGEIARHYQTLVARPLAALPRETNSESRASAAPGSQ
jgi:allantoinase